MSDTPREIDEKQLDEKQLQEIFKRLSQNHPKISADKPLNNSGGNSSLRDKRRRNP